MQTNLTLSFPRYALLCMKNVFLSSKSNLNQRKNLSPWITKGIKKSSKRKQKLYEKFLKKRNAFNETFYKSYTNLFEAIKRNSQKKSNSNMT